MFLKIAPCNDLKVSLEEAEGQRSSRLLEFQKEGGQLTFQVLLFPVDTFVKDLDVLKVIKWEAVIVDESQSLEISAHFSRIKSLSTDKRLLIICGQLSVNMAGYLDMLSLLDCDNALPNCDVSKIELSDISRLKENLSEFIAYECKSNSSKFVEFWVPVQISNVQLEEYCSMLLSNAMALSSCSKSDTFGALHDILVSNRKCCDHPYIVDQSLQELMTKDIEPAKFLDVGIKASGKLQFLDLILPEMRKRQLRVLILFQPLSGSGKGSTSIGDILDDFVRQRFGADSYERVDGIGTIPSKKQVALNNFNNKEMGRFVFLLEYRACLPSIKLSSVDTIVIFDSDWNPANDLRALQRVAIDSQSEQIMIFRLYTSSTLEEKILRLAEQNVTIDGKLQNLSRSTTDALLMWGAAYLFNKLAEFHSASELNASSEEECFWNELIEEFLNLISHEYKTKDPDKLRITKVQPTSGTYGKHLPSTSELITQLPDGEQPHTFWRNLLVGRNPSWRYLSISTPRHRKRPQYCEESPKKTNASNGDVGRKRKKTANNTVEQATEEGDAKVLSHEGSQSSPVDSILGAAVCDEASFRHLLKVNISKLCEVLTLSEDVKKMVESFLEYVIDNYRVNKEPANTLQAFLISLCWIGSALLKHKLDRSESLSLANKQLNFSCKEEEVNSVYLKLEPAKEMFLLRTENQKKTDVSKDLLPTEAQATSTRSLDPRGSPEELCSPLAANLMDAENETHTRPAKEQVIEITNDGKTLFHDSGVRDSAEKHDNPSAHSILQSRVNMVNHPVASAETLLGGQHPDLHSADRVDCQPIGEPLNISQNPEAPPQVLEMATGVSNHNATPPGPNLPNVQGSNNHNHEALRMHRQFPSSSNPLEAELEKLHELKDSVIKYQEAIKLKLKSDHEKELEEMIAQINRKYEAKRQDAEAAFQLKKKEVDINLNRVIMNKMLAEAFRSKCQDLHPTDPSGIQVTRSGGVQHPHILPFPVGHSAVVASSSPAQSSGNPQVTKLHPPLQIVNQTAKLFSTTPGKSSFNNNPSSIPARPTSNLNPTTSSSMPSRSPSNVFPISTASRPLPNTNQITPSSRLNRPLPNITPSGGFSRPYSNINPSSEASRSNINPATPSGGSIRPPPNINPVTPSSRPSQPPTNSKPTTPSARNLRVPYEIRAPAPHIRPFQPSTSVSHDRTSPRVVSSHHTSSSLSRSSPPLSQAASRPPLPPSLQTPPPVPANHNGHPIQNSPRNLSGASTLLAQASSQSPASLPTAPPASAPTPPPASSPTPPPASAPTPPPASAPTPPPASAPTPPPASAPTPPPASVSIVPPASVPLTLPTSFQLPSLYSSLQSDQHLSGGLPATCPSVSQISLPPLPSMSISHSGLYSTPGRPESGIRLPGPDILKLPALGLLMDIDKQAGFHMPSNMVPSPPEILDVSEFGNVAAPAAGDIVCLSDDE